VTGVRYLVGTSDRHRSAGRNWARFGDTEIVWTDGAQALGRGSRRAPALRLVTQVGRSFTDEHPEVTVLVEHGRHLVVAGDLSPGEAADGCWRVTPLPADTVVVDRPEPAAARTDPATDGLVAQVSEPSYAADLTWLASLPTRHSLSNQFGTAVTWADARMSASGYATTRRPVTVGSGHSENLVGDLAGTGANRGLVIVTAHLDSINLAGGPSGPAPGADDNASGSAGVLELGRVLASRQWQHDLRLILFGGEEEGLHGSKQYVGALPSADRARVRAVLNMDMIGTRNTATPTVLLEGAPVSTGQIAVLATAAASYTGLVVETSLSPFASDHVPFIDAGIPAVLTIEGGDQANGHIHSAADVLAHVDTGYAMQILRMNTAALSNWLGPVPDPPRPAGPVVAWGTDRLDVFVTGHGGVLLHKSWDGNGWQPATAGYESLGSPG